MHKRFSFRQRFFIMKAARRATVMINDFGVGIKKHDGRWCIVMNILIYGEQVCSETGSAAQNFEFNYCMVRLTIYICGFIARSRRLHWSRSVSVSGPKRAAEFRFKNCASHSPFIFLCSRKWNGMK